MMMMMTIYHKSCKRRLSPTIKAILPHWAGLGWDPAFQAKCAWAKANAWASGRLVGYNMLVKMLVVTDVAIQRRECYYMLVWTLLSVRDCSRIIRIDSYLC